jgi:hypothetical protein
MTAKDLTMNQPQDNTEKELTLHVRRCHICNTVNESSEKCVDRCQNCNKALAPFVFCESTYQHQIEKLSQQVFMNNTSGLKAIYPPLLGIALYW